MSDRILDISSSPTQLGIRNQLLVIQPKGGDETTVPVGEIAVVVLGHRQIILTQAVLASLSAAGGALVVCDERHMPCGTMLPLAQHCTQAERMSQQAAAEPVLKKRLWQALVSAKIDAQARLLHDLYGDDHGLANMARRVKSGDSDNLESQASQRYWPALFADPAFRRDREAEDQNKHLNYGYGVLRAIVGRAICAAGLNPSLGIHHHNRYDAFCLADDLMEPFRPLIDRTVHRLIWEKGGVPTLEKETKGFLLAALGRHYPFQGEERNLFDIAARTAVSLARVFEGHSKKLLLPEV